MQLIDRLRHFESHAILFRPRDLQSIRRKAQARRARCDIDHFGKLLDPMLK
ncbi:MAG: hypothetical protein ABIV47_05990 [Roseiflexaceae bacterium]